MKRLKEDLEFVATDPAFLFTMPIQYSTIWTDFIPLLHRFHHLLHIMANIIAIREHPISEMPSAMSILDFLLIRRPKPAIRNFQETNPRNNLTANSVISSIFSPFEYRKIRI